MERVKLVFPEADLCHRHPLSVRITDMNYGRHLGHDAVVSLMHEARVHALDALALAEGDMGGYPCVAADLAVQYQAESRWPEALVVETAIPAPGRRAIAVYHRIRRVADERTVATARINLMLVDPATGRPVAVPDLVCERLTGRA
ncbi:acyl-CoA thioesterase [Halomonas organivorans]|uniref:Acyl-CoA thioesterase FadM n=1 Tax=Halomonas organivorans TaxID=257772 RepID=A0A7W5C262_9GAMM|nr:thioesterase family protein [Halomonas organivorans]MBB3142973.1 acyl-CoA thioesterase FadM [Halomonas organivorans]